MDRILYDYAISWLGVPYSWGGSTYDGVDCSGLVIELLKSVSLLPTGYDATALSLMIYLKNKPSTKTAANPCFGAIAFFGADPLKITHVGFCLDHYRMIEAAGGNRTTKTKEEARLAQAFVKIRPISSRSNLISLLLPAYNQGDVK